MVFSWPFRKNRFYEEQAQNLVKAANILAITSTETITRAVPLIDNYFNTRVFSVDSWHFYLTIAAAGTAFINIADYVPKRKVGNVCIKISDELNQFHPKGYLVLENFSNLLHISRDTGIPFRNAVGYWLATNLLKKDQPTEEDIEAFSIAGVLIQQAFGDWFKKK